MESLEVNKLVRNADKSKSAFKIVGDVTMATEDLSIIFPENFINAGLANMSDGVSVIGIVAVIIGNTYSVLNIPTNIRLTPSTIDSVDVGGITQVLCKFNKGDIVLKTNGVTKTTKYLYKILSFFYIKGKIPWYISYEDASNFILESVKYTGSHIGDNFTATEIITSIVSYDPKNSDTAYRLSDFEWFPVYKGMNNQFHAFDNTTSKLVGAYFSDGVITSIVDKSEEVSNIEEIIRK